MRIAVSKRREPAGSSRRATRAGTRSAVAWTVLVASLFARSIAAAASPPETEGQIHHSLDLTAVHRYLATDDILTKLPFPALLGVERIVAFEDHEHFAYVFGTSRQDEPEATNLSSPVEPEILRRVYFIRPGLIVIDDQVDARSAHEIVWTLHAPGLQVSKLPSVHRTVQVLSAPEGPSRVATDANPWKNVAKANASPGRATSKGTRESANQEIRGAEGGLSYRCRSLLPQAEEWTIGKDDQQRHGASHTIRTPGDEAWIRSLHLVSFAKDPEAALPACSIERQGGAVYLQMIESSGGAEPGRTIRLWLPDGPVSGRIEIVNHDGKKLLPNRLLPAGILPPDVNAAQRRLQWDLPYQIEGQAIWDTKHASSELKRIVTSGQIKPCRAVEFGCGTGNDAIYLATQGFDVTAIDISPTALNIAEQKATEAGVRVNWLLADILHPPQLLKPFDFVYDRGCYHEVRQHHAKQYVAALKTLTHSTSKILILAGSANKDTYWRFEGPPRVHEQDIRQDFANGFRLIHLREFRFDAAPPEREGALAWSIFLERKR